MSLVLATGEVGDTQDMSTPYSPWLSDTPTLSHLFRPALFPQLTLHSLLLQYLWARRFPLTLPCPQMSQLEPWAKRVCLQAASPQAPHAQLSQGSTHHSLLCIPALSGGGQPQG